MVRWTAGPMGPSETERFQPTPPMGRPTGCPACRLASPAGDRNAVHFAPQIPGCPGSPARSLRDRLRIDGVTGSDPALIRGLDEFQRQRPGAYSPSIHGGRGQPAPRDHRSPARPDVLAARFGPGRSHRCGRRDRPAHRRGHGLHSCIRAAGPLERGEGQACRDPVGVDGVPGLDRGNYDHPDSWRLRGRRGPGLGRSGQAAGIRSTRSWTTSRGC